MTGDERTAQSALLLFVGEARGVPALRLEVQVDPYDQRVVAFSCSCGDRLLQGFLRLSMVGERMPHAVQATIERLRERVFAGHRDLLVAALRDVLERFIGYAEARGGEDSIAVTTSETRGAGRGTQEGPHRR